MTAPIIQAQYNELDQIAVRFGQAAEIQKQLIRTVQQQADVLTGGCWQGRGVTAFARELDNAVMPAMARLAEALLEAQRGTLQIAAIMHAAEEEAARPFLDDAYSGGAADGHFDHGDDEMGASDSTPADAVDRTGLGTTITLQIDIPTNLADLYSLIEEGPAEYPIQVFQLPNGEYVIAVRGTKGQPLDLNSWYGDSNTYGPNLLTGIGLPSVYSRRVQAIIEAHIPPGATIHLAGHSQGAHVSQVLGNLYAQNGQYSVGSVTSYGAYYPMQPHPNIGHSQAFLFVADPLTIGDLISNSGQTQPVQHWGPLALLIPDQRTHEMLIFDLDGLNPFASHNNYEQSELLQDRPPPFDFSDGGTVRLIGYQSPEEDVISKGIRGTIDRYDKVVDGIDQTVDAIGRESGDVIDRIL